MFSVDEIERCFDWRRLNGIGFSGKLKGVLKF